MKVKICGIKTDADLSLALAAGADAVGFITEVPVDTPRNISLEQAGRLIAKVPLFVTPVLVVMPENAESAISMIHTARPAAVQVHNDLPFPELEKIRETGVKLIKTVHIPQRANIPELRNEIRALGEVADAVLLDTAAGGKTGGTGLTHNWEVSADIVRRSSIPVILAGGLNPGNVSDAVRMVRPYAVDTASGVETYGKKDKNKILDFMNNARIHEF